MTLDMYPFFFMSTQTNDHQTVIRSKSFCLQRRHSRASFLCASRFPIIHNLLNIITCDTQSVRVIACEHLAKCACVCVFVCNLIIIAHSNTFTHVLWARAGESQLGARTHTRKRTRLEFVVPAMLIPKLVGICRIR